MRGKSPILKPKKKQQKKYKKYKAKTLSTVEKDYLKAITALEKTAKKGDAVNKSKQNRKR